MPLFTTPSQCYMLPSGFYVLGEIAPGEVVSSTPGAIGIFSDTEMEQLLVLLDDEADGQVSVALRNGMWYILSNSEVDTSAQTLSTLQNVVDYYDIGTNFLGATWPAGGTPYTVTADGILTFSETDRESFEVAIGKAMQKTGLYYDVDSVTRNGNQLTVTLDESQKPYDAGWDSVLSVVAGWFGGELP